MRTFRNTIFAVGAAVAIAASGSAFAHSKKMKAVPQDGAVLDEAPQRIEVMMTTPLRLTMVTLVGAEGGEVPTDFKLDMQLTEMLSVTPDALAAGSYTFSWRGLSQDGHPTSGQIRFEVKR
ncbi:copper resistance protein CopC [Rhodobacteraceae bacterium RKSG542]|uniref:copper resistance CopC family protein n=1 Tax=Pseudovibrio flavus TaxID=2529854 RepID=UPI0012BC0D8A|nr:copper resistance protein CopC [Pseudovibrio flavus]MTI15965.1 copper resistance protein CopC [Pseudovibrio flavus]